MFVESREAIRQNIYLEEINGIFQLQANEQTFDPAVVHDVSVSGAGIQLSEPLDIGTNVTLTFTAGDWKISVEGQVVWCINASSLRALKKRKDIYRIGIKFNPRNTNNNVIFFMASRSMVNPHM